MAVSKPLVLHLSIRTLTFVEAPDCCMRVWWLAGKLSVLHRLLGKLKARGHRVVLFSQFTLMLDVLEDYLDQAGHRYVMTVVT